MMDQEVVPPYDAELEDGEISSSSDEVYTPLERPRVPSFTTSSNHGGGGSSNNVLETNTANAACSPLTTCHQLQRALEEDELQLDSISNSSSSSDDSTDSCIKPMRKDNDELQKSRKRKKNVRRTVMVRVPPSESEAQQKRARFKKYNIWTDALQEEALTENMRECDVTRSGGCRDRNVENYDFTLRYRLNGENSLKRRLSNSTDDFSDSESQPQMKRGRQSSRDGGDTARRHRHSAKGRKAGFRRLSGGLARRDHSSVSTSGSDYSYEPLHIEDLEAAEGRSPLKIGQEIARKLREEKDELFVRIIEVLGPELPAEVFKETQRIEAEGGMMIKTGKRRRTSGGVFLFLLKNHDRLSAKDQKDIFAEDRQTTAQWRKALKAKARDRKVEELKKRLSEQKQDLPPLNSRKDLVLLGSDLSVENQAANLLNPPPSPVGHEQSPEYKPHAINHVASDGSIIMDKPSTSASALAALPSSPLKLVSYDDDFLDVNCGEMDFF